MRLLLHTGLALLDELLGHPGAAAAGTQSEGFGLEQQLLGGHLDVVLLGKLLQNGLEPCLFRRCV